MKNIKPIETYLILKMFLFGFVLLLPYDTFIYPHYDLMSKIGNDTQWGVVFILISVLMFVGVKFNSYKIKLLSISMSTFIWTSIGTMFLIDGILNQTLTTGLTYFTTAGLSLWLAYVVGGQR